MYKIFTTLCLFFSLSFYCQENKLINDLENSFNILSNADFIYNLTYDNKEETLYLDEIKSGFDRTEYKLLIRDIHPLGVYILEKNGFFSLMIISINNGNVFIKEGIYSRTINFVNLGKWEKNYKNKINIFIQNLKHFIAFKANKVNNDKIEIIINKKN